MSDETNICLSCGYCCEGIVVGFVQVGREEIARVADLLDIENTNGDGFFLQPCSKFCDRCTVYERRPNHCASYECGLLKAVDEQRVDFSAALDIIEEVRLRKNAIEGKVAFLQLDLQSPSFYFKMVEMKKLLEKNTPGTTLTQTHLDLLSEIHELDDLLEKGFDASIFKN